MLLAEQLTEGAVGEGTRILCQWKGGPKLECTYTKFDRPRYWEAYAASKVMDIAFACKVEPTEGGASITASMTLLPKGLFRIIAPLIRMAFQKEEEKNMEKKICIITGANSGIGISLGDDCVVEAGCYLTAGSKVTLPDGETVTATPASPPRLDHDRFASHLFVPDPATAGSDPPQGYFKPTPPANRAAHAHSASVGSRHPSCVKSHAHVRVS